MYLDTSIGQAEALSLYRSLGFAEGEPYYDTSVSRGSSSGAG
jgi:hypothetical protein